MKFSKYKARNNKCLVFTHQSDESGAPRSLLNILDELQAMESEKPEIYTVVLRPGVFSEKFISLSDKSIILPEKYAFSVLGRIYSLIFIFNFIKKYGPFDYALINSSVNLRAMTVCRFMNIPYYVYVRESRKMIDNFLGVFRRHLFQFSSGIICVSEDTRKWVAEYSKCVPVYTIRNGISFDKIANINPRKDPNIIRLVYVGFLDKRKGIDYFCQLVSMVVEKELNYEFLVVGKVLDLECLELLKQLQKSSGKITFTGVVDDALSYIANSDGLLMLSREEALPRVVLEASALGVPTIGFDVNGTKELLPPDYDLLFEIGDVGSVYDFIVGASKKELFIKGSAVKNYCFNNFNRKDLVSSLREVMESSDEV